MNRPILIFRTGQLGDALVSLPAIQEIRRLHLNQSLVLLTEKHETNSCVSTWDVLKCTGWFEDVIFYTFTKSIFRRFFTLLQLVFRIRLLRPEKLYYLSQPLRSQTQTWRDQFLFRVALGIRECYGLTKIGYPPKKDGVLPHSIPEWQRLLNIVKLDNGSLITKTDTAAKFVNLEVAPDDKRQAEKILSRYGILISSITIALGVGSKMQAKRWPVERYAELVRRLLKKYPSINFIILGAKEDYDISEKIAQAHKGRVFNLAGATSIMESAAVLKRCLCYVGNDTGTMHLAAAVNTLCVAIFSARDYPGRWEPFGDKNIIFRTEIDCAGCFLQECIERKQECITKINVDNVYQAVCRVVENTKNINILNVGGAA